jgi:hypothetical protein
MAATRGCFWFLRIGRISIVPSEKLETKNKPCRCRQHIGTLRSPAERTFFRQNMRLQTDGSLHMRRFISPAGNLLGSFL